MRTILLTRGIPASGKSTWIKENKLEPYTLSADNIRLLMQSPVTNMDGELVITQKNDSKVWALLFNLLEQRMERGEFIVVDGTHYRAELLHKYYSLIDKYRYRAYVVDFTDVPLQECIKRNKAREAYKFVPEEVLYKMHAVFEAEKNSKECKEVSNKFTIIKPDGIRKLLDSHWSLLKHYTNNYEKVVVFGDIHGCYEPLKDYFELNPFNEKYLYIFTGDYVDRGIQNKEVLEFLIKIKDNKNVILLEGNHEAHLRKYSEKNADLDSITSTEFKLNTIPQIESISKKDLRQLCRKFSQMEFFYFGVNRYVVCHGGIPCEPSILTPTVELIKGVGKYEDDELIGKNFRKNGCKACILVHAHRNIFNRPIKVSDNHYNLCDSPETGGCVRIIEIEKNGEIKEILQQNTVYNIKAERPISTLDTLNINTTNNTLKQMNESKLIQKKVLDNGIVSYNFTRKCFYDKIWNNLTCKARGLFVDSETDNVVARGYSKFHNIDELESTTLSELYKTFKFPVTAYLKENGFLGLVSYNPKTDDLFIASKSTNKGDYADMVREEINKLNKDKYDLLLKTCKDMNITFTFEVINKDKDPHIIEYAHNSLVLLDGIFNELDSFRKMPYTMLNRFAQDLGVKCKELCTQFNTWEEFKSWYHEIDKNNNTQIEGFVLEDQNRFMVKYKTKFYKFWKSMRSLKEKMQSNKCIRPSFSNETEIRVYNYMRTLTPEELKSKSIIDIRKEYLDTNKQ